MFLDEPAFSISLNLAFLSKKVKEIQVDFPHNVHFWA